MGKMKLLLDVVEDMRSLADSLQAIADAMTQSKPPASESDQATPVAATVAEESPLSPKKAMSKEELRTFLSEKSLALGNEVVQALIHKYGCRKFSEIDPKYYPALQKDAEELHAP